MLRNLIGVGALLAVLGMTVPAQDASAQGTWPEKGKTITWLIPYAPAGGFDLHSRAVSVGLKKALGVNVILRNRPGAGGTISWNLLWKAKPDGYTIGTVNIPGAIVSDFRYTDTCPVLATHVAVFKAERHIFRFTGGVC